MNIHDEHLETPEQKTAQKLVSQLPDEQVSMAWRAQLNEKLNAVAKPVKQAWWQLAWKPALGMGLAGALSLMLFLSKPAVNDNHTQFPNMSAQTSPLLEAHEESRMYADFGMITIADNPTTHTNINWSDLDKIPL